MGSLQSRDCLRCVFGLRLSDGKQIWKAPPPVCGERPRCSPAQSAAVSAIPGVAFSESVDGHLRAYSAADGKILWDFDTQPDFPTVNGVPAHGGSMSGSGPVVSGNMLYVASGFTVTAGMAGNVVLAFEGQPTTAAPATNSH